MTDTCSGPNAQRHGGSQSRSRRGAIMALLPVLILALAGISVLMIDLGHITAMKSDAQNAADAASLAGALQLRMQYDNPNYSDVADRAVEFADANNVANNAILVQSDIVMGKWNYSSSNFNSSAQKKNGVKVTVHCDCTLFFAHIFGTSLSQVDADSISAFQVTTNSESGEDEFSIPYVVH
jgi:Flp pilus assembly protein TadG